MTFNFWLFYHHIITDSFSALKKEKTVYNYFGPNGFYQCNYLIQSLSACFTHQQLLFLLRYSFFASIEPMRVLVFSFTVSFAFFDVCSKYKVLSNRKLLQVDNFLQLQDCATYIWRVPFTTAVGGSRANFLILGKIMSEALGPVWIFEKKTLLLSHNFILQEGCL